MRRPPSMTLEEKIAQLFVLRVHGPSAETQDSEAVEHNQAAYGVDNAAALVSTYQPGGIVYFRTSGNIDIPTQIATLSNSIQRSAMSREGGSPVPLLISVDQEGGRVARMSPPVTWFPSAKTIASLDVQTAENVASIMATELRALGINQNYAPVADVVTNPENRVIGDRSFSSDPDTAAAFVRAQIRGFQRGGLIPTVKHFPGHGGTAVDTHTGRAVIEHSRDEWERLHLPPFRAALEAGVDAVMTGHLVFPALDPSETIATASYPIITDILRGELGFDGVVVTDGLGMEAARVAYGDTEAPLRALQAGVDQLLTPADGTFPGAIKTIRRAVEIGELSVERIDESVDRILRLKAKCGLFDDPYIDVNLASRFVGARDHLQTARRVTGNLP
ncbi:glycoside hydrolase family 3 protein [Phytoactinopolyspora halophila]|nr:glycoside hydrolase family 3 protein [Phytoactinopolyspora halophila]